MGRLGLGFIAALLTFGCSSKDDTTFTSFCGYNAEPSASGECECVGEYTWCEFEGEEENCCAYFTHDFSFELISVKVAPYKDEATQSPWDWDGDLPDWLLAALDLLAYYYPNAATWAAVLDLIDTYAPELLEGTVPPDPYVQFYDDRDDFLYETDALGDTYEPYVGVSMQVSLIADERFSFWVIDEDALFDDDIQGILVDLPALQLLAGRGDFAIQSTDLNLFEMNLRVEPR